MKLREWIDDAKFVAGLTAGVAMMAVDAWNDLSFSGLSVIGVALVVLACIPLEWLRS